MSETKNCQGTAVQNVAPEDVADALMKFIKGLIQTNQTEELKPILQDIRDSLKRQVQINKEIYDELISSQKDSLRREFINHMIGIHRLMEDNFDYIVHKMPEEFGDNLEGKLDKVIELFGFIKEKIVNMLIYDYGLCVISPSERDPFNPGEHFVVGTESTDDKSLKNTVGRLVNIGFKDATNNLLFRRADIIAMRYTEECNSTEENSSHNNNSTKSN